MVEIDNRIMEYLHEYGNTKESDLIGYLERQYELSDRGVKKALERMEKAGNIFRVVHEKLKPPGVYIGLSPKAEALLPSHALLPRTFRAYDELGAEIVEAMKKDFEKGVRKQNE